MQRQVGITCRPGLRRIVGSHLCVMEIWKCDGQIPCIFIWMLSAWFIDAPELVKSLEEPLDMELDVLRGLAPCSCYFGSQDAVSHR